MLATACTSHESATEKSQLVYFHPLPSLDGQQLQLSLVEVRYGPGAASPPHRHPCAVVGYVIEGALRTQVAGQTEAIYHAGESFYEEPNAQHIVSANASQEKPVRFLAYFTCDQQTPLSLPLTEVK